MGKDVNSIKNTFFCLFDFCLLQLVRALFYGKHKKNKWSNTEQASNKTVAKKSWR